MPYRKNPAQQDMVHVLDLIKTYKEHIDLVNQTYKGIILNKTEMQKIESSKKRIAKQEELVLAGRK